MCKFFVSVRDVVSNVAKWGVAQSPFDEGPDDLQVVLKKLCEEIKPDFKDSVIGFIEFGERRELCQWLNKHLYNIPELVDWNLSKVEKEKGIKVDNPNRSKFNFVSRYDKPKPDYDFIDLDALVGNVARSIIDENYKDNGSECKCKHNVVEVVEVAEERLGDETGQVNIVD